MPENLFLALDSRCTDPRWAYQEVTEYFGEEGWQDNCKPGVFGVRAGSDEEGFLADDAIGAVVQAMEMFPEEDDFEIEGWMENV